MEVFDWDRNSDPDFIGGCETSLKELMEGRKQLEVRPGRERHLKSETLMKLPARLSLPLKLFPGPICSPAADQPQEAAQAQLQELWHARCLPLCRRARPLFCWYVGLEGLRHSAPRDCFLMMSPRSGHATRRVPQGGLPAQL